MQSLEQLDQFTLTGLDNRNRYMELLEAGKENALKQVGGIYICKFISSKAGFIDFLPPCSCNRVCPFSGQL